jgi:hypothetical protein
VVHGFKTRAESLAREIRGELRLSQFDCLSPGDLAALYGIPVIALSELSVWGASHDSIAHFLGAASGELSAFTITHGTRRLIVHNPDHSLTRQSNSICHEMSHVLLEHEAGPIFGIGGCRRWNDEDEEQANWLAGVLLVPAEAALSFARRGTDVSVAARQMGVSPALMTWRLNKSGATTRVARERNLRAR